MKLLVAIKSDGKAKTIGDYTLRWAGRGGYALRLFVPGRQVRYYAQALKDANYDWYLALEPDIIIKNTEPMIYAYAMDYDLLVTLPDDMEGWKKTGDFDRHVYDFAEAIGRARKLFSEKPRKRRIRFSNGAIIERVRKP